MAGTLLNVFTILLGSLIGLMLGNRFSQRIRESLVMGLGFITLYVGISNANSTGNIIIPLVSVSIGVVIGELLHIDRALERFAAALQARFSNLAQAPTPTDDAPQSESPAKQRFITGFITASLLFCIGPLTLVGSIQDGMGLAIGFQQLAIKSVLDGIAAAAFAASFGVGVMFTALTVLVIQGSLALLGSVLGAFMTDPMIAEMTATGGILLIGLTLTLLDLKQPRMANFLPALIIAPLMIAIAQAIGFNVYPSP